MIKCRLRTFLLIMNNLRAVMSCQLQPLAFGLNAPSFESDNLLNHVPVC